MQTINIMNKVNYGIDAPGIMRNLICLGVLMIPLD